MKRNKSRTRIRGLLHRTMVCVYHCVYKVVRAMLKRTAFEENGVERARNMGKGNYNMQENVSLRFVAVFVLLLVFEN